MATYAAWAEQQATQVHVQKCTPATNNRWAASAARAIRQLACTLAWRAHSSWMAPRHSCSRACMMGLPRGPSKQPADARPRALPPPLLLAVNSSSRGTTTPNSLKARVGHWAQADTYSPAGFGRGPAVPLMLPVPLQSALLGLLAATSSICLQGRQASSERMLRGLLVTLQAGCCSWVSCSSGCSAAPRCSGAAPPGCAGSCCCGSRSRRGGNRRSAGASSLQFFRRQGTCQRWMVCSAWVGS